MNRSHTLIYFDPLVLWILRERKRKNIENEEDY